MSGYVVLFALLAGTAAGLWWAGRLRGAALQLMLAALMLGGAGYALQGWPSLPGSPRQAAPSRPAIPLTEPRQAILGTFTPGERYLLISDSYARRGNTGEALGAVQAGLKVFPKDLSLRIGLANALVDHAGMNTPAAKLAFQQARALAPQHPAPYFFEALGLARSGEREQALALFQRSLALTPEGTSYRPMIVDAVEAVSRPLPVRGPFQRGPTPPEPSPRT